MHLDSCSLTNAYTLLPGDHCSLLTLSGCQSDGMLQNELSGAQLISFSLLCARTVCSVIYYLNNTGHPPPPTHTHTQTHTHPPTHPPTEGSILARCIAAHKRGELYYLVGINRLCWATFEQLLAFWATLCCTSNLGQLLPSLATFEQQIDIKPIQTIKRWFHFEGFY